MRSFIPYLLLMLFATSSALSAKEINLNDLPYAGLILDKVELNGIEITNFRFDNDLRVVHVKPNENLTSYMHYKIDSKLLSAFQLSHLVIGLYDDEPQECILHSLGIKDSAGDLTVMLKSPSERGVYEVRVTRGKGITCDSAKKDWWKSNSSKTVLGYVVVA